MSRKYNWNELKIQFMTGDYNNLRDFAKEQGLSDNSNFRRMTKGWVSERDTQLSQMCLEATKNSLGKKAEEFVELKQTIDEAGTELFCLIDDFIKNKDYSKFPIKQRPDGKVNTIDVLELDFIKINEVNKAVNALTKLHKILKKAYPSLSKATGC
jgi:hypothetical protein